MPTVSLTRELARHIATATGRRFTPAGRQALGGGCINQSWMLEDGGRRYFVKLNDGRSRHPVSRGTSTSLYLADALKMFEAEAEGLHDLAATDTVRVPRPVCSGIAEGQAFLALEYLPLRGLETRAQETLGAQLARLHRATAPRFGWKRDNTIGATPQPNDETDDWIAFWRERRLGFQLGLAADNGHAGALQREGEKLLDTLPAFFRDYRPVASLLHGDLWGGNAAATDAGTPVIFDPAVYYGDRETDLAMTELFGGFGARFHAAYREAWPLDPGYRVRKNLYNLYHVLNHLNLFGGGYRAQAQQMIERLLAEVR